MRRFAAVLWTLAGCGQAVPPAAAPRTPEPAREARLEIPRAPFAVVPAELGDERVLERIPHRAMMKRWTVAWLTEHGAPFGDATRTDVDTAREILPVIGERGAKIRIVVDDDHARYAVWVSRADTWSTALVPLALAGPRGAPATVWIEPGVALEEHARRGALREIAVVDEMLSVRGLVDARGVGEVWVAPSQPTDTRLGRFKSWQPPRDHDVLVRIPRGAELRARADSTSPTLATVTADELVVGKLGTTGAFTEVEAQRPYLRVRGFVETAKVLGVTDDLLTSGTGSGHGFGMSHAVRHEVPAGTCLYDRAEGDVVGVTLEAETRLGGRLGDDGWAMVYIDSPWRATSMYLKNLATDPGQPPSWDSCVEPAHRR